MENSPPRIHTIPSGAGSGGVVVFAAVGRKTDALVVAVEPIWTAGVERTVMPASIAVVMMIAATLLRFNMRSFVLSAVPLATVSLQTGFRAESRSNDSPLDADADRDVHEAFTLPSA